MVDETTGSTGYRVTASEGGVTVQTLDGQEADWHGPKWDQPREHGSEDATTSPARATASTRASRSGWPRPWASPSRAAGNGTAASSGGPRRHDGPMTAFGDRQEGLARAAAFARDESSIACAGFQNGGAHTTDEAGGDARRDRRRGRNADQRACPSPLQATGPGLAGLHPAVSRQVASSRTCAGSPRLEQAGSWLAWLGGGEQHEQGTREVLPPPGAGGELLPGRVRLG